MSPRRAAKLPEDLARLTRRARSLRQWSRSCIQDEVEQCLSLTMQRFTPGEYEQRRAQRQRVLTDVSRQHENLDKLFNSANLPISNKHSMVREWRQSLNRLSQSVSRLQQRNSSSKDKAKAKTKSSPSSRSSSSRSTVSLKQSTDRVTGDKENEMKS